MRTYSSRSRKILLIHFIIATMVLISNQNANGQNSINGPTCANFGVQYAYSLSAYYSGGATFNYWVTGGTLSTGGTNGNHVGPGAITIYVTWSSSSGSVSISSPNGLTSLSVQAVPVLSGGAITSGQTQNIAYNTTPATINCSAASDGPCSGANYVYQWLQSPDNVSFSNVSGATGQNLSFTSGQTATRYFKRKVTETTTNAVAYSDVASVILNPPNPILTVTGGSITPASQNIYYNHNSLELASTGVTNGTYSYSYQWQSSPDNATWANVPSTALVYTAANLTSTTYFRVAVTSNGVTAYSSSAVVNVYPRLYPGTVFPENITIPSGGNPQTIVATMATGGDGSYSYQWQSSTDGTSFSNISGATSLVYAPGTLTSNKWYRLMVISGDTVYTNTCTVVISNTSPDLNFVRVRDIKKPGVLDSAAAEALTSNQEVLQTTQYYDGLGRSLQLVAMQQGPLQKDVVSFNVYDGFGRETVKYLSYVASTADGNYKVTAQSDQHNFNAAQFPNEQYYFSQTAIEPSPLNRPVLAWAPGISWVGSLRGSSSQYNINTALDSVRIWTIGMTPGSIPTTSSIYTAGTLFENTTTDETGNLAVEYKDLDGKVILKKIQLASSPGSAHVGWLCTYYVYDVMNHLRFVIQPQAVVLVNSNWTITTAIAKELCFRYEYDQRGRLISKQVPGAGEVWMVYDAKDRLVMSQDSLLRAMHKWLYTLYDALSRPTTTGLITDNTYYNDAAYHRGQAESSTAYPNPASYTNEELTKVFYDNYTWRSNEGNPLSATRDATYDGYLETASNTVWPYPQNTTVQSSQLNGIVTGTKTKVLGTSTFLYSVSFYDDKGRVIQVQSQNISGGADIVTTQYGWAGQPLLSIAKHEKAGGNSQTSILLTKLSYDDLGRVTKTEKKISSTKINSGSMPGSWATIVHYEYDALGQLKKKKLGADTLETLTFDYNIRGWMLGANRDYVKDTTSTTNWFGFDLGYDKTSFTINGSGKNYTTAQYNGNIAGMLWKSTGDDHLRKYDFTYDAVNRLTSADFNQLTNNTFSKAANIDFSVNGLTYDGNGNILNMNLRGWKLGGSITIDSLLYTYTAGTNKLLNVFDRKNDTATKLGDFRSSQAYMTALSNNKTTAATDYTYDGNGNMYVDNNKNIGNIQYNYLNLPDSITVTNKGTIKYIYDAVGNKLKKITTEGSKVTTTLYLVGNYINDTLQFIGTEEGRSRMQDSTAMVYDYFIKDHLGNVRMVLTDEKDTAFYPAATMETAAAATENLYYSGIEESRVSEPEGYPYDSYDPNSRDVSSVRGDRPMLGPAIVLKVMAGDKFNVRVSSWYNVDSETPDSPADPLSDIISGFQNGIEVVTGGHPSANELSTSGTLTPGIITFLTSQNSYYSNRPKAFLNWVLFDERFNYVSSSSGFEQVGDDEELKVHTFNNMPLYKSGYLYIYVSNETPNINVFFDNLQVTHIRGPLLEETHYYPFGLTMSGISGKALGFGKDNKKQYVGNEIQNKEFTDGSGLEVYDFNARTYDHQLGRFIQIDPLSEEGDQEGLSPYHYSYNNPVTFSDPDGKCPCLVRAILVIRAIVAAGAAGTATYAATQNPVDIRIELRRQALEAPNQQYAHFNGMRSVREEIKEEKRLKALNGNLTAAEKAELYRPFANGPDVYRDPKSVPNPDGKKGGKKHQETVSKEEERLKKEGYDKTEREVKVETPGGNKEKRYIDLQGTKTKTGEKVQVQVGKKNKNGTPVSREKKALDDVEKSTGTRPTFTPYN